MSADLNDTGAKYSTQTCAPVTVVHPCTVGPQSLSRQDCVWLYQRNDKNRYRLWIISHKRSRDTLLVPTGNVGSQNSTRTKKNPTCRCFINYPQWLKASGLAERGCNRLWKSLFLEQFRQNVQSKPRKAKWKRDYYSTRWQQLKTKEQLEEKKQNNNFKLLWVNQCCILFCCCFFYWGKTYIFGHMFMVGRDPKGERLLWVNNIISTFFCSILGRMQWLQSPTCSRYLQHWQNHNALDFTCTSTDTRSPCQITWRQKRRLQ